MIRKQTVYHVALFAWLLLSSATVIVTYSGQAEPYVAAAQMPGGEAHMIGGIVGAWVLGALVVGRLTTREWKAAGRAAGLTPDGGMVWGKPDLTGTVGGRSVRARTIKRNTGGGGEGGSSKSTFTIVEADLDGPTDRGLVLGHGSPDDSNRTEYESLVDATTIGEDVWVIGAEEAFARDLLDQRSQDALRAVGDSDGLYVGDAAGMLQEVVEEATDSSAGTFLAGTLAGKAFDKLPGDASTVSTETKGLVLDADALEVQARAVAAVADAFEAATGER